MAPTLIFPQVEVGAAKAESLLFPYKWAEIFPQSTIMHLNILLLYLYGKERKRFTASSVLFLAALHLSLWLACYFTKEECPIFKRWKAVCGVEITLINFNMKEGDLSLFPYDKEKPI